MIFFDFVNRYYPKIIFNIIKRNFIPEKNGDLPNNFTICDTKNCTNKADTTNKLYFVQNFPICLYYNFGRKKKSKSIAHFLSGSEII